MLYPRFRTELLSFIFSENKHNFLYIKKDNKNWKTETEYFTKKWGMVHVGNWTRWWPSYRLSQHRSEALEIAHWSRSPATVIQIQPTNQKLHRRCFLFRKRRKKKKRNFICSQDQHKCLKDNGFLSQLAKNSFESCNEVKKPKVPVA